MQGWLAENIQFHMAQTRSAMTPTFDRYGPTGYEIGEHYECTAKSYKCRVKSINGKLLCALPGWLTKSLQLYPKWSNPIGSFQLALKAHPNSLNKHCLLKAVQRGCQKSCTQIKYEYKGKEAAYFTRKIEGAIFADFPLLKDWGVHSHHLQNSCSILQRRLQN
jgi:hypothetical protein